MSEERLYETMNRRSGLDRRSNWANAVDRLFVARERLLVDCDVLLAEMSHGDRDCAEKLRGILKRYREAK